MVLFLAERIEMPGWLVDALYYALIVLAVLVAIDGFVFVFMWRVSVYRRNLARRRPNFGVYDFATVNEIRRSVGMPPSIHNDKWFSAEAQKELYRDFTV